MKAVEITQTGGPEVMQLVDVDLPEPAARQVRIKVEACGLNYSDIMIRRGLYVEKMPLPYRMGREFCGTIDTLGPDVSGYQLGQRVVGTAPGGALAEYVVAPAAGLMPLPEGLSPAEGAAFLIQGITAMHCLEDCARLRSGETVLVHAAAGGVGTLAVQIAKAKGAKVFGTASSDAKCETIQSLGATAINYASGDWVDTLRQATDGNGADVILESVGGDVFHRSYHEALATFGRMVVYGIAGGEIVRVDNREILMSNKSLIGYYLGTYFPKYLDRVVAATAKLMTMMAEGHVKPIVGQTFTLSQAADAFEHLETRKSIGKVVVTP